MTNRERAELIGSMVMAAKMFHKDGIDGRAKYNLDRYSILAVGARNRARGLMIAARLIKGPGTGARVVNAMRRAA